MKGGEREREREREREIDNVGKNLDIGSPSGRAEKS